MAASPVGGTVCAKSPRPTASSSRRWADRSNKGAMVARPLILLFALAAMPAAAAAPTAPAATVEVVRDGDRWTADYRLHARAPVWAFAKSILPRESARSWRLDSVRVLTPGVTL